MLVIAFYLYVDNTYTIALFH